jgi:hypothetical protein
MRVSPTARKKGHVERRVGASPHAYRLCSFALVRSSRNSGLGSHRSPDRYHRQNQQMGAAMMIVSSRRPNCSPDLGAAQRQQQRHADDKLCGSRQVPPSPAGTCQHGQACAPRPRRLVRPAREIHGGAGPHERQRCVIGGIGGRFANRSVCHGLLEIAPCPVLVVPTTR